MTVKTASGRGLQFNILCDLPSDILRESCVANFRLVRNATNKLINFETTTLAISEERPWLTSEAFEELPLRQQNAARAFGF